MLFAKEDFLLVKYRNTGAVSCIEKNPTY